MDLDELRTQGLLIARKMIELRTAFMAEEERLRELVALAPDGALPGGLFPYLQALVTFATFEAGDITADSAAERMSKTLQVHDVYCTEAAQAMPPAQQMELMLQGRFAAAVKGN